jgi:hypothetical protein
LRGCYKVAALALPRFVRIAPFDRVLRFSQAPTQLPQPTPSTSKLNPNLFSGHSLGKLPDKTNQGDRKVSSQ